MSSQAFWYGVVFSFQEQAEELIEESKQATADGDSDGSRYYMLRAAILTDLNRAIRAGLDRQTQREMSNRPGYYVGDEK